MSGGANKSFLSNPSNFLQNNVLTIDVQSLIVTAPAVGTGIPTNGPKFNAGATININIEKDTMNSGLKANGDETSVYKVTEAKGCRSIASHRFSAYYLPFFGNDFRTMTLGTGADFFFTDTMNGCSFACGPGTSPKVGHFNQMDVHNMIDQHAIDLDIAGQFPGGTLKDLKKPTYKNSVAHKASLIGIRTGGTWSFYYQIYEIVGAKHPGMLLKIEAGMPTLL